MYLFNNTKVLLATYNQTVFQLKNPKYGSKIKLLLSDTDSLMCKVYSHASIATKQMTIFLL